MAEEKIIPIFSVRYNQKAKTPISEGLDEPGGTRYACLCHENNGILSQFVPIAPLFLRLIDRVRFAKVFFEASRGRAPLDGRSLVYGWFWTPYLPDDRHSTENGERRPIQASVVQGEDLRRTGTGQRLPKSDPCRAGRSGPSVRTSALARRARPLKTA